MTRSFRVAMVAACPFPYPRGTPVRIFRMAEVLSQRGHEVHVVTYHLGENVETVPFNIYRIPQVKTYQKCSPGPTYQKLLVLDVLLALKLSRVLQQHRIDLIHAHHYEGLLVAAFNRKLTHLPVIYDAHTLLQSELPFYGLGLSNYIKKLVGYRLDNWFPKLADHIISVSDQIRLKLIKTSGIAPERVITIPNGVEYQHFDIPPEPRSSLQHPHKKVLLFTGNLAAYQGIESMLEAFRQVLNQRSDVQLCIVSNSSFDDYEALACRLGVREHIDLVPSDFQILPRHFANADIVLNPRVECDGLPMKLLNYMASGRPIVSFAGSANGIKPNETGMVVEDRNIPAFAEAICQLLANPTLARQLGINAQKEAKTEYTWEQMAEKVEAVYEQVCGLKRSRESLLSLEFLSRWLFSKNFSQ